MIRIIYSDARRDAAIPAIFIDRDGVINCLRTNDYVLEWRQFVFVPGIREALRDLSTLQLPMIVISNQAAVGKGLLRRSVLEEITARLHETLLSDSISLDGYYYCPHRVDERCDCRKPSPNMLRRAAADFNIDLTRSVFIGDSDTDVQAARSAGCQPVLFGLSHNMSCDPSERLTNLPVAPTTSELYGIVVRCLQAADKAAQFRRNERIGDGLAQ
jgi:histidinol-phosphate phosphatase family protein